MTLKDSLLVSSLEFSAEIVDWLVSSPTVTSGFTVGFIVVIIDCPVTKCVGLNILPKYSDNLEPICRRLSSYPSALPTFSPWNFMILIDAKTLKNKPFSDFIQGIDHPLQLLFRPITSLRTQTSGDHLGSTWSRTENIANQINRKRHLTFLFILIKNIRQIIMCANKENYLSV